MDLTLFVLQCVNILVLICAYGIFALALVRENVLNYTCVVLMIFCVVLQLQLGGYLD